MKYVTIVLFFLVLVLPFGIRQFVAGPERVVTDGPMEELSLRIVTPHNQDIRREFARAFNNWHRTNFGTGVDIIYLTPGGTNDIIRLLESKYKGNLVVLQDNATVDPGQPDMPPATQPASQPATKYHLMDRSIDIDLFWGGGDFEFNRCKRLIIAKSGQLFSVLAPMPMTDTMRAALAAAFPSQSLNGVRLVDTFTETVGPQWVGVCLSEFGIVYNPTVFRDLGLDPPTKWADMASPKLMGFVALADPTRSGSAGVTYMMILQRAMADEEEKLLATRADLAAMKPADRAKDPAHRAAIETGFTRGMAQLLFIAANSRYFTDSASIVPKDVSTGDAAIGTAIDFYGRTFEEQVGAERIKYVSPVASTAVTPDPIAILHGTFGKRLDLASRFVEFLLTPEAQHIWIKKAGTTGGPTERSLRRPPVRQDVYADQTDWSDKVNAFASTGGFNQRAEWMGWYSSIRPVWAAAWIDTREPLRRAYRSIMAVPDATKRQALLDELGAIPITLSQIENDSATARTIQRDQPQDAPQILARRRIDWAKKLAVHYNAVAAKAR